MERASTKNVGAVFNREIKTAAGGRFHYYLSRFVSLWDP